MGKLDGKKVAILATDGFEEAELLSPRDALQREGATVEVLSPTEGTIRAWKDKNWSRSVDVDRDVGQAQADEYDALVLPGGVLNADRLRVNEDAVRLVSEFFDADKPVAAICHAPWILIEADAIHGRQMTSYQTLKTDLMNAGADWVDEEAVEDENLLTSRAPADLPAFNEKLIELISSWSEPSRPLAKVRELPSPHGIRAEHPVDEEAGLEVYGELKPGAEPEQPRRGLNPQELSADGEGEPVAGVESRREDEAAQATPLPSRRLKKRASLPPPASRGVQRQHSARRPHSPGRGGPKGR